MNQRADASEDLLYGLLALQNGLIQQSALIGASRWTAARERPMADVLADRGVRSTPRERVLLAALVDAHLKLHGGDAQRSLAVISPGRSTFASLEALGNDEINASLGHIRGALHVTRGRSCREHPQLRGRLLHERRPEVPRPAASCAGGPRGGVCGARHRIESRGRLEAGSRRPRR